MENIKISFKGFVVPRDEKHAEWLRLGQEIGEIKSPILDPDVAEQFAQVARIVSQKFGNGILFFKIRDEEIEIEYKQISVSANTNTTTNTATGTSSSRERVDVIKVTRENRAIILRQLAKEGWQITFRNILIEVDDTGYYVNGSRFTTLNAAVKHVLDSSGKATSQVNAWEAIRLVKDGKVAKLEL